MKHDEEIALRLLLIESGLTDEEVLTKVTDLVSRFAIAAYTDGQSEGFTQARLDLEFEASA